MRALVVSDMALIAATYGLARFGYGLFLLRFTETFQMGSEVSGFIGSSPSRVSCGPAPPRNSEDPSRQPHARADGTSCSPVLSSQHTVKQSDRADRDAGAAEAGSGTSARHRMKGQS